MISRRVCVEIVRLVSGRRLLIQLALMAFVAWKRVFLIRRHMVFVTAISVAELVAMVCSPCPALGLQLSTLVVLQSTQSGGTFSTLVLGHSVDLVLGYSYSVVLSSTQLKP